MASSSGNGPPSPFLMLLPNASTSTLESTTEEVAAAATSPILTATLENDNSATTNNDAATANDSLRSSTSILSSAVPGNVFPQLNVAPIPAFFSTSHRAVTSRPDSWHLHSTIDGLDSIATDTDESISLSDKEDGLATHLHPQSAYTTRNVRSNGVGRPTAATGGPPSSSTLWQAWKQQDQTNRRRSKSNDKKKPLPFDSDTDSISKSSHKSQSTTSELIKQSVDYSIKGWSIWFIRLGLVHLCLPFVNGVMLGFGEICANEVTIRTGWLGLRALTDNYLHR
ncbi:hypothetical protein BDF19DRAFT_417113 [Syncephalis fuscata]|nr:hypothetical protein BDF19DRAFT_417113 [Syncephalis fuscata]